MQYYNATEKCVRISMFFTAYMGIKPIAYCLEYESISRTMQCCLTHIYIYT